MTSAIWQWSSLSFSVNPALPFSVKKLMGPLPQCFSMMLILASLFIWGYWYSQTTLNPSQSIFFFLPCSALTRWVFSWVLSLSKRKKLKETQKWCIMDWRLRRKCSWLQTPCCEGSFMRFRAKGQVVQDSLGGWEVPAAPHWPCWVSCVWRPDSI